MVFPEGDEIRALKLFNTGNVALIHVASGNTLWQSFNTPTDTFLPGMKLGQILTLTSWKSLNDPGTGSYEFLKDKRSGRYLIMKDTTTNHWQSGNPKNSFDENALFPQALNLLSNTTTRSVHGFNKTYNITYMVTEPYSRLVMSYTGHIQYFSWRKANKQWVLDWQEPKDSCSVYKVCGSFGMCSQTNDHHPSCSCLPGFQPASRRDHMAGCKRKSEICQNTKDTFVNLTMISIDDTDVTFLQSNNESVCIQKCLENCQCVAYSYRSQQEGQLVDESRLKTQGCWFWNSEPNNLKEHGRHNISVRVSGHHVNGPSKFLKRFLPLAVVIAAIVLISLCGVGYNFYNRLVNRIAENIQRRIELQSNNMRTSVNELLSVDHSREDECEGVGVPYFDLETIRSATANFSLENKLGEGGFGPVFKGELGGQVVAVKRLESVSGQGVQEFTNEVTVIAKLQHRNLVRLLGYCVAEKEKILIYEYMPNKSLDANLFDPNLSRSLDWNTRFNIIVGISRGLCYIHHDSRVQIIHRDFKTSNILLDEHMNAKISDFGMAKIITGNDTGVTTERIFGTQGYIAPEYGMHGAFSWKSDVYSFGVVLLEIVSGKSNATTYESESSTKNLIGQAWSLWVENKPHELMDQTLMESCNPDEVLKCIIIGLLCIQSEADDRPTMSNVVLMLGSEVNSLPIPKKPILISRMDHDVASSSGLSKQDTQISKNMLEITELVAR